MGGKGSSGSGTDYSSGYNGPGAQYMSQYGYKMSGDVGAIGGGSAPPRPESNQYADGSSSSPESVGRSSAAAPDSAGYASTQQALGKEIAKGFARTAIGGYAAGIPGAAIGAYNSIDGIREANTVSMDVRALDRALEHNTPSGSLLGGDDDDGGSGGLGGRGQDDNDDGSHY